MPAVPLPPLSTFKGEGRPFHLDGNPGLVRAGATLYRDFSTNCLNAAGLIKGLNSTRFIGDEADLFRDKLDDSLPEWLEVTGKAHEVVAGAVEEFAEDFAPAHQRMQVLVGEAPGLHTLVNDWAHHVNRLEGQLETARGVARTARIDHAASVTAAASTAATPAAPATAAKEVEAAGVLAAAEEEVLRLQGELATAISEHRRYRGQWDDKLAEARRIHDDLQAAAQEAQGIIDGQKDAPFEKNPTGLAALWSAVSNWIDENADVLGAIADALVFVGSLVAMLPGLGTVIGGALVGLGMLMSLALTINGNRSWAQFAMSAIDAIPGAGKAVQLGKFAKVGRQCANDPVDVFTGDIVDLETDLQISGALPFTFERHLMTSFRAGRAFGPSWASLLDTCVEIDESSVTFIGPDGLGIDFEHPTDAEEVVSSDAVGWRLSFVDGAYRVRQVANGLTFVFSMVGDSSMMAMSDEAADDASAPSPSVVGEASLAARTGFSVLVGLSSVTHHSGHFYEVDWDLRAGRPELVRLSGGAEILVKWDDVTGRVESLAVRDPAADGVPLEVVAYEYSARGELVAVVDGDGAATRYEYDAASRVCGWVDRNGMGYRYGFDDHGRCDVQAGSGGVYANATVYLPDNGPGAVPGGRLSVMIQTATALDIDGVVDVDQRWERLRSLPLVSSLNARGIAGSGIVLPDRDTSGGQSHRLAAAAVFADVDAALWVDEVLGDVRCEIYRCDPNGDVWQQIAASGAITTCSFDHKLVTRQVDAHGGVHSIVRDADGLVVEETFPDGTGTQVVFGSWAVPARVIDAAGRVTEVETDGFGNVVSVTAPGGFVSRLEYEYRASGSVLSREIDASGSVTEFDCDAAGRVERVIDPSGRVTSLSYDVFGNVTSVLDPDGQETVLVWSRAGRLVERVWPDGSREAGEYDAEGNLVASVDEVGGRRTTVFGPMDAALETVDAAGARLRLRYDTQLQVREVINPDGLVWTFEYDRAGRLVGEVDYNGARTGYEVDAVGRVVARVDALGRRTVTEYDDAGRVTATVSDVDGRTEFRFGSGGELVEAVNADAVVRFDYDPDSGARVGETVNGVQTRWRVDPRSRSAVRSVQTGDGVAAGGRWDSEFSWDSVGLLDRVATEVVGAGGVPGSVAGVRFGYDRAGREVSRWVGVRAQVRQRFDVRSRLVEQVIAGAVGGVAGPAESGDLEVVGGRSWSYRRDSYVEAVHDLTAGTSRYALDGEGRITAAGGAGVVGERFGYSGAGVLERVAGGGETAGVASSPRSGPAGGEGDRPVVRSGTLVTRVGRDRFVYDAAGQLVVRERQRLSRKPEVTRLSYTAAGQIRTVTAGDGSVWRYGYDAFGRRVSKTHSDRSGGLLDSVVFGWDGDDLIVQSSVAHTGRGGVEASAATTHVWVYHPDTAEPLEQHTRHYTPATGSPGDGRAGDGVGGAGRWSQARVDDEFYGIVAGLALAPTELLDPVSGRVAGRAVRSVWGRTRWVGVSTPLRFAGQQFDEESGLHYNRYRYYDPVTASYTSADPLGVAPNPASATAYVHNPHTWVDPLGLKQCPPGGVVYLRVNPKTKVEYVGRSRNPTTFRARQWAHNRALRKQPGMTGQKYNFEVLGRADAKRAKVPGTDMKVSPLERLENHHILDRGTVGPGGNARVEMSPERFAAAGGRLNSNELSKSTHRMLEGIIYV